MSKHEVDEINDLDELNQWAADRGLKDDPFVDLRRLDLLSERLNPVTAASQECKHPCPVCGKKYKQRKHLLRHQRSVHGAKNTFQCTICQAEFNRKDSLERHIKLHQRKRKAESENADTSSKRKRIGNDPEYMKENVTSQGKDNWPTQNKELPTEKKFWRKRKAENENAEETNKRKKTEDDLGSSKENIPPITKCNWCTQNKVLLPGKKFCAGCGDLGRECRWCHRPLPERFYSKRTDVCDSCINRKERWAQSGGGNSTKALEGSVETTTLQPNAGNLWDILQFFIDNESSITTTLQEKLLNIRGIKWYLTLYVKFVKYNQNNEAVYAEPVFRSINFSLTNASEMKKQIAAAFQNLYNSYQNFERDGSGWTIDKILKLEISIAEYTPLSGSSYIPLPPRIKKKKAALNIQNNDQKCFLWSIIASIHPVYRTDNPCRVSNYIQYEKELNTDGLVFPVPLSQIKHFEKKNEISVNVFGLENNEIFPLQITEERSSHHVNLLLFSKGEKRHYCLIRNVSRLLGDRTNHNGESFYCNYCLHGFCRHLLDDHVPYCSPNGPQKLSFPKSEEQKWIEFKHINKQLRLPFVIYADFECFTSPVGSSAPNSSCTKAYQKHEPSGFCYYVKCSNDELSKPAYVYRGSNTLDHFFDRLMQEEKHICEVLDHVKPMSLSSEEEAVFQKSTKCHICEGELGADRVRDHDHLSGRYRGAAHSHCNLQYQFRRGKRSENRNFYIPVVFHNLRGYDLHLMMQSVGKLKESKISCIPNNMEKYISFSLDNLRFIDSYQFMNSPLEKLVGNLSNEGSKKFHNLNSHFPCEKERDLLLRKGVYPYDYMDSELKFADSKLPAIEDFYNRLTEEHLSEDNYHHAQNVWQTFHMKNMGQYHDLYLKTDVLLLADVFENFRDLCLAFYHLDPAHYYTSPGLAWEAMLKMTRVKLELLDDIDMVLMIEKGIRGGVSMISKKYAKANNPEVPEYDPTRPNTWISYLDMNNLYGTSMVNSLPERDFAWLNDEQLENLDIDTVPDDSETGYILEVDLEYPEHLHDDHSDYPLAPENFTITNEMLSPHTLMLREKLQIKSKPSAKLVPNLQHKKQYVTHYRNLKYYLSKGMVLTKIHRGIEFSQSPWMKPYIDFNTQKRSMAKNDFEKDFFKLMNNAVFGKTMENMRKRMNVELVNSKRRLRKLSSKPNFLSFKIFDEDLVAVNLKKANIVLNRPIYAGFCILELSKIFMYEFHYDYMTAKYGNRASLLFTDTDSLCYEVETNDIYEDMMSDLDRFDTSNFEKDHFLHSKKNCKVLGKMKDENGGKIVQEFIGLKPKMYSLMCQGGDEKRTAKGIKKYVIDKYLKHDAYKTSLSSHCSLKHSMNMIRSFNHQLYSITVTKTSLSPYDDKRYVLDSGVETLAHGHYRIASKIL